MAGRRDGQVRTVAALLALLVQALIVAFVGLSRRSDRADASSPLDLIFIQAINLPQAEQKPARENGDTGRPRNPAVARLKPPEPPQPSTAPTAITVPPLAPPVDWQAALEDSARRIVQQGADREKYGEPLDSKPRVLAMPSPGKGVLTPGTITQLPNGEVMVQLEDGWYCIYSPVPLSEKFDVWARNRPPKCTKKNDKDPFTLDEVKPNYLRKPLP